MNWIPAASRLRADRLTISRFICVLVDILSLPFLNKAVIAKRWTCSQATASAREECYSACLRQIIGHRESYFVCLWHRKHDTPNINVGIPTLILGISAKGYHKQATWQNPRDESSSWVTWVESDHRDRDNQELVNSIYTFLWCRLCH